MGANRQVFINMRVRAADLRGVQRYTAELQAKLKDRLITVAPDQPMQGWRGHLWEQTALPRIVGEGLLWSPANTGPLRVRSQVLTIHDIASLEHPEWFNSVFAAWYRWLTPALIKRVQRVITVSEFSRERLLALTNIDESKIAVIPLGVDAHFRMRGADDVARVRSELGIPSPYYLLSLAAMEPRKNLRRLLAAWASCVTRLPQEIWLVLAGSSAPSQVFRGVEMGDIPPRVHFAGFIADVSLPALYSGALALLYVSIYEGFGLPALEAMASGTVPIVAGNTSLPEVVGDAGLQVNPYDVEDIAAAIERVINDSQLRQSLAARASQHSRQFNWERTAIQTWNVLSEAMAC